MSASCSMAEILMAQFDIESACHDVPVHSDDWFPFGMK